jgi:hypothetical protein
MKYKLNIIEPWESGTEKAIDATVFYKTEKYFLLFTEKIIKVRGLDAQWFVSWLRKEKDYAAFVNQEKGVYRIQMVFDKDIHNKDNEPVSFKYRANFLSGEIII